MLTHIVNLPNSKFKNRDSFFKKNVVYFKKIACNLDVKWGNVNMKKFIIFIVLSSFIVLSGCNKANPIDNSQYNLQLISQNYGDWKFMQRASATADLYIGASEGIEISHQISPSISYELFEDLSLSIGYSFSHSTLKISSVSKEIKKGETIEFYYRTIENKFQLNSHNSRVDDIMIYSNPQYAYVLYDTNMNVIEDTKPIPTPQEELDKNGLIQSQKSSSIVTESDIKSNSSSPSTQSTAGSDSDLQEKINGNSFSGRLEYTDQEKIYTFTATNTGKYRFDLDINDVRGNYKFVLYNSKHEELIYASYTSKGKTVELVSGENYKIVISTYPGYEFPVEYTINIGTP